MSRKLNIEEFIEKARLIHGDKYDYSKVCYVNNHTKVCIICPEHGEFWQTPKRHLNGDGCKKCFCVKMSQKKTYTNNEFIELAKKKYGDFFDYSFVNYVGCYSDVCVVCPTHGKFKITPIKHLQNEYGCPFCYKDIRGAKKRDTVEEFIEKARLIHGDKYDYSKVEYINSRTKVCIICPEHGEYKVLPSSHIHYKSGCPICQEQNGIKKNELKNDKLKELKLKKTQLKLNTFIEKAKQAHGDKYDYSKVCYVNNHTKVCIICPEHGEFWQTPNNHIRGCNCPFCAKEYVTRKNKSTIEEFIEKARLIHGDKYDYSKVEYINNHTKVCIICPEHGEFWQTPSMHSSEKQGCPNCSTLSSKGENEVVAYIQSLIPDKIVQRDKTLLGDKKEIDIWVPSRNIAIEYNGLRWHSEIFNNNKYYHLTKTLKCKEKNINLIHIFEDEWLYNKDIVKSKIRHLLNVNNGIKIYGRKCIIKEILSNEAKFFLTKNHIQGSARATKHYGAFYEDNLIAVMSFIKEKNISNNWELTRFATDNNYVCCGVGGKLFKYFIKKNNPDSVKSFADRRWTVDENNNIYVKLGFKLKKILPPQYSYVSPLESCKKRYHKFNFRKQILLKKYPNILNENMTENEMTKKIQYYKIYDCGLFKYVWENASSTDNVL